MSSTISRKILILIDLNGTLHNGNLLISRSVEALKLLRSKSDKFCLKFVTNSTKVFYINLCYNIFLI